ncbi:glutamic acid-rich protein-like [Coffea eugenioides]|uniref:glutamic acid-rich protein-like n=1 Tax=Coffea eugenioides TaxID=49369 RepID=UPI000F6104EF|nr:glutamic acid-rich protein-like [Coffea eugenioides]
MEEQQSEGHPVSDNEEKPVQPTNADVTVTKSPRKGKRTAKRKSIAQPKEKQTVDPSGDQQNVEKTAEEHGKRKRPEQPETHTATEPTSLPKFIDDEARERKGKSHTDLISRVNSVNIELNLDIVNSVLETKIESDGLMMTMTSDQQATFVAKRNLLVPPIPPENENAQRKEPRIEPTTETTPEYRASSSQPQDKGKAPTTEEETEEEDDDDEDEDTEEEDPAQFRLARRRPGSSKITF